MRVTVIVTALVYQDEPSEARQNLSAIDASPLLLKVVNCPAVKFDYSINFDQLRTAAAGLLNEYPIIGGRLAKVFKHDIAQHPYLKSAPYCIDLSHPESGVLLCEAKVDCCSADIDLHAHLADNFNLLGSKVDLPPWYQPLSIPALFKGKEPLLKLQLTHTRDGGCILAATMPHLLADSHSSTLLLTRLAELYKQRTLGTHSTARPSVTPVQLSGLHKSDSFSAANSLQLHAAAAAAVESTSPLNPAAHFKPISPNRYPSVHYDSDSEFLDLQALQRQSSSGFSSSSGSAIMSMVSRKGASYNSALNILGGSFKPVRSAGDLLSMQHHSEPLPTWISGLALQQQQQQQQCDSPRLSSAIISFGSFSSVRSFSRSNSARSSMAGDTDLLNSVSNTRANSFTKTTLSPIISRTTTQQDGTANAGASCNAADAAQAAAAAAAGISITAAAAAVSDLQSGDPPGIAFSQLRLGKDNSEEVATRAWSKDALLAGSGSKRAPTGAAAAAAKRLQLLKSLSLDLQSTDTPTLRSTLSWLAAAARDALAAAKHHPAGAVLTSRLLHIPNTDLQQLKGLASRGTTGNRISTNDALSALVWLLFCDLRHRPLPGSSSSSSRTADSSGFDAASSCCSVSTNAAAAAADRSVGGYLGMAIDLRHNCKDLQQQLLPAQYFGNAAWCLHISGSRGSSSTTCSSNSNSTSSSKHPCCPAMDCAPRGLTKGVTTAAAAAAGAKGGAFVSKDCCDMVSGTAAAAAGLEGGSLAVPLQVAAAAVRSSLTDLRSAERAGSELLKLVTQQQAAPKRVLVRNLARLAVKVDGFITSWQFPITNIDFGSGPPTDYSCTVRPTPPWQAAVLPNLGQGHGVKLLLTVPATAVEGLRDSVVLKKLAPNATFMT